MGSRAMTGTMVWAPWLCWLCWWDWLEGVKWSSQIKNIYLGMSFRCHLACHFPEVGGSRHMMEKNPIIPVDMFRNIGQFIGTFANFQLLSLNDAPWTVGSTDLGLGGRCKACHENCSACNSWEECALEKISSVWKCQACNVGVSSHGLSWDGMLPSGAI